MFGKMKKRSELLEKSNIVVGVEKMEKEAAIKFVGNLLVSGGYVEPSYVDGMLERELSFSTNMGNGLAIPHGVESAKKAVKNSGIAIVTCEEGIEWDGSLVKMIIGIAGKGEEHIEILANIADKLAEDEVVSEMSSKDAATIYDFIVKKEA